MQYTVLFHFYLSVFEAFALILYNTLCCCHLSLSLKTTDTALLSTLPLYKYLIHLLRVGEEGAMRCAVIITLTNVAVLQYMMTHLNFLQYVLQEGVLYLSWNRARDIWATMVANPRACDWDREVRLAGCGNCQINVYLTSFTELPRLGLKTTQTQKSHCCHKKKREKKMKTIKYIIKNDHAGSRHAMSG